MANSDQPGVIEVVTLKVKAGVSLKAFREIDAAVGREHVAQQPGFISRETASNGENDWLVIVHWRSAQDADASMASFGAAAAAQAFMDNIDAASMVMKRYVHQARSDSVR